MIRANVIIYNINRQAIYSSWESPKHEISVSYMALLTIDINTAELQTSRFRALMRKPEEIVARENSLRNLERNQTL